MKTHKKKPQLSEVQLSALSVLHKNQIATEVVFVALLLALISIRVSLVWMNDASVCAVLFLLLAMLLFGFGLALTIVGSRLDKLGEPLTTQARSLRLWFRITWFTIPGVIALNAVLAGIKAPVAVCLACLLLIILWFFSSITIVLIKAQSLWRSYAEKTKYPVRIIAYSILGLILLVTSVFATYTTSESVAYGSTTISDGNLEVGQSEVRQPGKNGEKLTTRNLIFGFITSTSQKDAVDQIEAKGTRRYQYMYCSDGSSRYYPADQFKNPAVGFTHQSPDYCAQNGQGTMTTLADVPQAKTQYITTPSPRTSMHCYSSSYSRSIDCYSY